MACGFVGVRFRPSLSVAGKPGGGVRCPGGFGPGVPGEKGHHQGCDDHARAPAREIPAWSGFDGARLTKPDDALSTAAATRL